MNPHSNPVPSDQYLWVGALSHLLDWFDARSYCRWRWDYTASPEDGWVRIIERCSDDATFQEVFPEHQPAKIAHLIKIIDDGNTLLFAADTLEQRLLIVFSTS